MSKRGMQASRAESPPRLSAWHEDSTRSMGEDEDDRPATAVLSPTEEMRNIRSPQTQNASSTRKRKCSRKKPERSFPGPGAYDEIRSDVESHHKRSYLPTIGRPIAPPTPKKRYDISDRLIGRDETPEVGMSVMLSSAYAHRKHLAQGSGEIVSLSGDGSAFVRVHWKEPADFNEQLKWCSVGQHGEYWLSPLKKRKSTPPAQRFVLEALVSPRYDYDSQRGMFRVNPSKGRTHIPRNHSRTFGMGIREHVPPGSIVSEIMREVLMEAAKRRADAANEKKERTRAPAPKTQFRTAADDERDRMLNEYNAPKSKLQRSLLQVKEIQGKELRKLEVGRALEKILVRARSSEEQFNAVAIDDDDEIAKEEVRAKTLDKVRDRQAQKLGLGKTHPLGAEEDTDAQRGGGSGRRAGEKLRRGINQVRVVQKLMFAPLATTSPVVTPPAPPASEENQDESSASLVKRKGKKPKNKTEAERLADKGYEVRMSSVLVRDTNTKLPRKTNSNVKGPRPPAGTAPAGSFRGRAGSTRPKNTADKGGSQSAQAGENGRGMENIAEENKECGCEGQDVEVEGNERAVREGEEIEKQGEGESRDYGSDGFESEGEDKAAGELIGEDEAAETQDQRATDLAEKKEEGHLEGKEGRDSEPVSVLQSKMSAPTSADASAAGKSGEVEMGGGAGSGAGTASAVGILEHAQASEEESGAVEQPQQQQQQQHEDEQASAAGQLLETQTLAGPEPERLSPSVAVDSPPVLTGSHDTAAAAQPEVGSEAENLAPDASNTPCGLASETGPSSESAVSTGSPGMVGEVANVEVSLQCSPPAEKRTASFKFNFQRAGSNQIPKSQQAPAPRSPSFKMGIKKDGGGEADIA